MQNLEQERQSLMALVNAFNERARLAGVPPFSMSCEDTEKGKKAEIDFLNKSSSNLSPLAAATLAERRGWVYLPGDEIFPIGNGNGTLPSSPVEALRIGIASAEKSNASAQKSNGVSLNLLLVKGDWIIEMSCYVSGTYHEVEFRDRLY